MEFDTFYFGTLTYNPNYILKSKEEEETRQIAHLNFLADLNQEGILLAAGPFEGGSGIYFFDVDKLSRETLLKRLKTDPHAIAGSHSIELKKWMVPKHTIIFTTKEYFEMKFPRG